MKKNLLVIFYADEFSGHEKMALKITQALHLEKTIVTTSYKVKNFMPSSLSIIRMNTIKIVISSIKRDVLLILGSPYGGILLKICIWAVGGKIIEYTPFPELKSMRDRFHHRFVPLINKITIKKRILIEDWQIPLSAVKDIFVIKNLI